MGGGTGRVHPPATGVSRPGAPAVTCRRDADRMSRLTTLLASYGNRGAVANARSVLDGRRREEWLVEGLLRRLEPVAPEPALPAAADRVA